MPWGLLLKGGLALGKRLVGGHLPALAKTLPLNEAIEHIGTGFGLRFLIGFMTALCYTNEGVRHAFLALVKAVGAALL